MVSRRIWGYRAANRLIYTGYLSFCSCSSFIHLVLSPVSAMVKGGAGQTTIIPATNYCAGTQKNCATKDQLGLCVSATTCKSDNVIACVEVSKNDCIVSGGSCIQTKCDCLNTYALTCNCE